MIHHWQFATLIILVRTILSWKKEVNHWTKWTMAGSVGDGTLGTSRGHILGDALSFSSDCWSEFFGSSNFQSIDSYLHMGLSEHRV